MSSVGMDDHWQGWHFLAPDRRLQYGDGRKVIKGRTLSVDKSRPLELCGYGLHASPSIVDALKYAPGLILCRVELIGQRLDDGEKSCAYSRRVIAWADASSMLRLWACWCARRVWNLLEDERSRNAVIVSERFARGEATRKELRDAGSAANEAWIAIHDRLDAFSTPWEAASAAASAACFTTLEYYPSLAIDTTTKAGEAAAYAATINATDREIAWSEAWKASRKAQSEELERRAMELLGITVGDQ